MFIARALQAHCDRALLAIDVIQRHAQNAVSTGERGAETRVIGYEETEVLGMKPAVHFVRVIKREKRACAACVSQGVVTAPAPERIAPKSIFADETIIEFIIRKYCDALPLYRQRAILWRDPRHLGAEIGFFSVLHTWNQRLQFHPHAHCMLAAGGLSPDHTRWISSSRRFFLPIKVLSRVFRGKFVAGLRAAFQAGTLQFHGNLRHLAEPRTFASWLRTLFRQDWVVYAKRPFGGPQLALRYLGAYTHRVNHRLVALEDGNVTFRWRDSAHGNKKKLMTLVVDEFLRRFLLHLLPRGFVRIRHFGFLANRRRARLLPVCFGRKYTEQINTTRGV